MLNTYIKNRGITKTIFHDNNHNHINQIAWDADYDGDIANISLDTNTNGRQYHYDVKLNNEDLANILNIQGVNMPIHKRLQMDFKEPTNIPEEYFIELPTYDLKPRQPKNNEPETSSLEDLLTRHVSSPKTGEELIVPLTIDRKTMDKYTLTPKRRHRRLKTHVTHRVYKKPKTKSKSRTRSSKSKSRTSRSKSTPILELL